MAQTTTDTAAASTVSCRGCQFIRAAREPEAEFGCFGALLPPLWWEPEDGSEPEPWLTPDQAFERFFFEMDERSRH